MPKRLIGHLNLGAHHGGRTFGIFGAPGAHITRAAQIMATLDSLEYNYPTGIGRGPGSRDVLSWRTDADESWYDLFIVNHLRNHRAPHKGGGREDDSC